jgi:hypothetical protein
LNRNLELVPLISLKCGQPLLIFIHRPGCTASESPLASCGETIAGIGILRLSKEPGIPIVYLFLIRLKNNLLLNLIYIKMG